MKGTQTGRAEIKVVGGSRRTTPRPALSHPSKVASHSGRLLSAEEQASYKVARNYCEVK
jgi:hypothetical protein